jgi:hypothetical protein
MCNVSNKVSVHVQFYYMPHEVTVTCGAQGQAVNKLFRACPHEVSEFFYVPHKYCHMWGQGLNGVR